MIHRVAIIGAGFSGTLLAINLLRHDGPRAVLIERTQRAGSGVAYGAAHPSHLLNVRAGNMSAFPDDPGHFVRWLEGRGVADPHAAFVRRAIYGEYLEELLAEARQRGAGRLEIVKGHVVAASLVDGVTLDLADGRVVAADAAVLAVGNLPPHHPPGLDAASLSAARYKPDPWHPTTADGLSDDDVVLVIGTGLTMVDMALTFEAQGFGGRIIALSRRGLLPHRHEPPGVPATALRERPAAVASVLVHHLRQRGEAIGWRSAVDELRPFTQALWAAASANERERFLRHLRPWWDVHRHRLAPAVAARIAAMQATGQLTIQAGKTLGVVERPNGVEVTWRPRGGDPQRMTVQRIVNCTGPQGDLARTSEPLLRGLVDRGAIRPDGARLGIDVDASAAIVDAHGRVSERLFAVGPMTRGAFWEIVAVPDIRAQSWRLARRLANAHWVGGEGL